MTNSYFVLSSFLMTSAGSGGFRSARWYASDNGITIALAVNQFSTDPNTLAVRALDAVLIAQGRSHRPPGCNGMNHSSTTRESGAA